MAAHTVRPLDRVVLSVLTPLLVLTGVAKPLFSPDTPRADRLRRPWLRLRANRRDAMAAVMDCLGIELVNGSSTLLGNRVDSLERAFWAARDPANQRLVFQSCFLNSPALPSAVRGRDDWYQLLTTDLQSFAIILRTIERHYHGINCSPYAA